MEKRSVPNGQQKMGKLPTCLNLLKYKSIFSTIQSIFDLARLSWSSYCIFMQIKFQMAFTFDSMWPDLWSWLTYNRAVLFYNICLCSKEMYFKSSSIHGWKFLQLKFLYSEKATNFFEISTVDLSYVVPVKPTVEILQNFVAFSEYMNFNF